MFLLNLRTILTNHTHYEENYRYLPLLIFFVVFINAYTYELYDIYGVLVDSGQSQNVLKTLDTSTLLEGIYFLHFYENGLLTIEQIVVDH